MPTEQAVTSIEQVIAPLVRSAAVDLSTHQGLLSLERRLIERAGPNCRDLGANALLPVSIALWRAAAALHGQELYAYIREFEPELAGQGRVRLFSNVLNGGYHAPKEGEVLGRDRFTFQEMQVVPRDPPSYRAALTILEKIDATLKALLISRFGAERLTRADEAGLTVRGLGDNIAALDLLVQSIRDAGFEVGADVRITLDPASSHLYDSASRTYDIGGRALSAQDYGRYLLEIIDRYPGGFASIEDPLEENDWEGLTALSVEIRRRGVIVVGDDFYVTQKSRLEKGIAAKSANGLMVKPNQNGSLHGTFEVMKLARRHDIELVISHRSGETLDDTIADIAWATGAFGIKTGAPQPETDFPDPGSWFRRQKYLRLVEIEQRET